jgi:hypothetical protein
VTDPFDSYIANITKKTGKTPEEIWDLLKEAGAIVSWLKTNLDLGHGHAMAIVKWAKDHGEMPAA